MRFRSVVFLLLLTIVWIPAASAQKRVSATVNPNSDVFNITAEIYDPSTGAIAPIAMHTSREQHIAERLTNGKVLIAGGYNNRHLKDAELYDPSNGTFTAIEEEMATARSGAASVLLPNGLVLIFGGYNGAYLSSAETYDPVTGEFNFLSSTMLRQRQNPRAVLLKSGLVLITGGFADSFLQSAEIYNPVDRVFTATTTLMQRSRAGHSSTLLPNGKVLIAGGCNNSISSEVVCNNFLSTAELYDPATDAFTFTGSMATARKDHNATLLADGKVLITGGMNGADVLSSAEIYDPETGVFTSAGNMGTPRMYHTSSMLPNGSILIAGGQSDQCLASAEVYAGGTFSPVSGATAEAFLSVARSQHSATVLNDGKILLAGGRRSDVLTFDVNVQSPNDNVAPNIYFTPDSTVGFVSYTGSGVVLAFSPQTGEVLNRIHTGGKPAFIAPLLNHQALAVVSVLDNRIFVIDTNTRTLQGEYSFAGQFGFGSHLTLSADGRYAYVSSTASGEVLKLSITTEGGLVKLTESGRLTNLSAPARITLARDPGTSEENTLLIVDTLAATVVGADARTMARKFVFNPRSTYSAAVFSIFDQVVLNADHTMAMVTSQDYQGVSSTYSAALIFDPITGTAIRDEDDDDGDGETDDLDEDEADDGVYGVGTSPGASMLLPGGNTWLVLSQNFLSLVPTIDPRIDAANEVNDGKRDEDTSAINHPVSSGSPARSANMVLSPDAKYVFYASATVDRVFQQNVQTGAVIGAYLVGDDPNRSVDQATSIEITPDSRTLAVTLFNSNELDLLVDSNAFRQTRYISARDQFTGLSILNLSNSPTTVTITAMANAGGQYEADLGTEDTGDDVVNPVVVELGANAQKSVDVSVLFNMDASLTSEGFLVIESNQPVLVGYTATGNIQGNFLSSYIRNMQGIPLVAWPGGELYNAVLPEIPESTAVAASVDFVNPGYTKTLYDVTHYSVEGTKLQTQEDQSLASLNRQTMTLSGMTSDIAQNQVLILGGVASTTTLRSAELFSANALSHSSTSGYPKSSRQGHAGALLPNGKVLIAGGKSGFTILKSAELFNPASSFFALTPGVMNVERYRHTATRLTNGKVLLAGGQNSLSINRTAELYDPVADTFRYTENNMSVPRESHTATRLLNGKVLIAGGLDGLGASDTVDIYDPVSNRFVEREVPLRMHESRAFHTAVLLNDGKVLISGGYNGNYLDSAELYDPETDAFITLPSMTEARSHHTATLLSDGTVLIAGGDNAATAISGGLNTAEIFNPADRLFSRTNGNMTSYRTRHTAVNFMDDATGTNDRVVLEGGFGHNPVVCDDDDDEDDTDGDCNNNGIEDAKEEEPTTLDSVEIYAPKTGLFEKRNTGMGMPRQDHTAIFMEAGVPAGYLRIQSDYGLLATQFFNRTNTGATAAINGINIDKYVGIQKIYSPRFVVAGDQMTVLNIINANEDSDAEVTLTLYSAAGGVVATRSRSLAKNAQLKGTLSEVFLNSSLADQVGWLEVSSSADRIVGTITFTNSTNQYLASYELSGSPMARFVFPLVSQDATYETELSFLNTGAGPASVVLEMWAGSNSLEDTGDGVRVATRTLSLEHGTSLSGTLDVLFPGVTLPSSGNVRVVSSQPIYGMGELRARNHRFITAVPPVANPVSSAE